MIPPRCRRVQEQLTQGGPTAFQGDEEGRVHLVECDACFAFMEALAEVDRGLEALPPLDAPDALVARVLSQARDAEGAPTTAAPPSASLQTDTVSRPPGAARSEAEGGIKGAVDRADPGSLGAAAALGAVPPPGGGPQTPPPGPGPDLRHGGTGAHEQPRVDPRWDGAMARAIRAVGRLTLAALALLWRSIRWTARTAYGVARWAWGWTRASRWRTFGAAGALVAASLLLAVGLMTAGRIAQPLVYSIMDAPSPSWLESEVSSAARMAPADRFAGTAMVEPDDSAPGEVDAPARAPSAPPDRYKGSNGSLDRIGILDDAVLSTNAKKKEAAKPQGQAVAKREAPGLLDAIDGHGATFQGSKSDSSDGRPRIEEYRASGDSGATANRPSGSAAGIGGLAIRGGGAAGGGSGERYGEGLGAAPPRPSPVSTETVATLVGAAQEELKRDSLRAAPPPPEPRRKALSASDLPSVMTPAPSADPSALAQPENEDRRNLGKDRSPREQDRQRQRADIAFDKVGSPDLGLDGGVGLAGQEGGEAVAFKQLAGKLGAKRPAQTFWEEEPLIDEKEARGPSAAEALLAERDRVDGLSFKEATGYWANTYVPGDPQLRLLQSRMRAYRLTSDGGPRALMAHQPTQPFDAPEDAALAVYLHTDRPAATGPSRALVQVGLKGTPRLSGSRPAMNVGLVLDLTGGITAEGAASVRALLQAFEEARDLGDRLSVTVAGPGGGTLIQPPAFRHGPLKVMMDERLPVAGEASPAAGPPVSLPQALALARDRVASGDDPSAPLGSSALILITPRTLGDEAAALAAQAHFSAVDGIPVSAVGIGVGVDADELNSIALAGQGNRRALTSPTEAEALVEREITAVARVVARAVRLRIRLAPGVKLVDVLGSRRLDEAQSQQVREAEQSIDRRIARNMGITSDRGEDEEGIQIVIPAYYAGDSHVILLDVVAPGPGPIADVTVRYKDLVYLKNGVARANLSLPRGEDAELGPLEANVLKNLLAHQLSASLQAIGAAFSPSRSGAGQAAQDALARRDELRALGEMLAEIQDRIPPLYADPDLTADRALLSQYAESLEVWHEEYRRYGSSQLSDTLRYAGLLKVLPEPRHD